MADYREISQQYAHGAIKACILINGAAAIALLSQAVELLKLGLSGAVSWPMLMWAGGTLAGASTWILGLISTRYVDKSEREQSSSHLLTSDRFMKYGVAAVVFSLLFFLAGCIALAFALCDAAPQASAQAS